MQAEREDAASPPDAGAGGSPARVEATRAEDPCRPERLPGPLSGGPKPLKKRTHRKRSKARRAAHALAARVARAGWATVRRSLRIEVLGRELAEETLRGERPRIVSFWHEHTVLGAGYLLESAEAKARLTYLVSPSVDGDLVERVLCAKGGHVIRGSATRSAIRSLKHMYRAMSREGASPVVIPDGPHGPARECKPGALMLARLGRAEILPVAFAYSRTWRIRSWDRMHVPLPFARLVVAFGEPFEGPDSDAPEVLESASLDMAARLDALEESARARLGSRS